MAVLTRLCIAWLCCALVCAAPARAAGTDKPETDSHTATVQSNADAKYDLTGDGLVDAEDWAKMTEKQKTEYARDSLLEIGLDPDAPDGNGRTRLQDYLDGLRSVYGP